MFTLLLYKTGWDYNITTTEINAHAPSRIILKCVDSTNVSFCPKIKNGGQKHGKPSVIHNTKQHDLKYDLQIELAVTKGDTVELHFSLDKNENEYCWSYWETNAIIAFPTKFHLDVHCHLGDSLAVLAGLECISRLNDINLSVCKHSVYKDILSCFEFQNVTMSEDVSDSLCLDGIFESASWDEPWMERFGRVFARAFGFKYLPLPFPICKISSDNREENLVLFQFDARSAVNLDKATMRRIIGGFRTFDCCVIGGVDSNKYLGDNYSYAYGNLELIIKHLLKCAFFVGVDSGMAHLAGILGTKLYIINLIPQNTVMHLFSKYPSARFVDRDFLLAITINPKPRKFECELKIIAAKRSGMHAIINWIASQLESALFINNVSNSDVLTEPVACQYTKGERVFGSPNNLDKSNAFIIYNHEDKLFDEAMRVKENIVCRKKLVIVIIRDPYNLVASRKKKGYQDDGLNIWTDHLKHFFDKGVLGIYFNKWFCDEEYRKTIIKKLAEFNGMNITFNDSALNEVPDYGMGSSFDHRNFNERAQSMNVLNRFLEFPVELPEQVKSLWESHKAKL